MATPDPNLTLAVVFERDDPVALNVAEAALKDAGIEFAVTEDALPGYGFSPMLNPVFRIQVASGSEAQARELIDAVLAPDPSVEAEATEDEETSAGEPTA
ncbi:MAG TPA: DUF2007 domain-containing protein [Terracidiphilus sp.]|jgi:hypothetical protein